MDLYVFETLAFKEIVMLGYMLTKRPGDVYRIDLGEKGFTVSVKTVVIDGLLRAINRKELYDEFQMIRHIGEGEVTRFFVDLPFIPIPNRSRRTLNWEGLSQASKEMSLLLWLLNMSSEEAYGDRSVSNPKQHLLVRTIHSANESGFHAHPLAVGFSEESVDHLARRYPNGADFPECQQSVFGVYARLVIDSKEKRDSEIARHSRSFGGMFSVVIRVRERGVPQFIVPGNCSCLGANPDEFKYDRDLHSHNLDSSLQQITMLAAVVTFWNKVLRPLTDGV